MSAQSKRKIMVGCSGWSYEHWRGLFYPDNLPPKKWFAFYAETFDTVEINNTFYNLPAEKVFRSWAEKAGKDFVYSIKANRYITHVKRLKDVGEPIRRFLERARLLKEHLGPILYQLPPRWRCDVQRLENFLALLPDDLIHVFEFRDQSWLNEDVFALLEGNGASFCAHDMHGIRVPRKATGRIAYVRFHGPGGKYRGRYAEQSLRPWARWLKGESAKGRDIYAYFNNDEDAHAVQDARTLRGKLLGSRTSGSISHGPAEFRARGRQRIPVNKLEDSHVRKAHHHIQTSGVFG